MLTQSEIDARKKEEILNWWVQHRTNQQTGRDRYGSFDLDLIYFAMKQYADHKATEERQRAKVLLDALLNAKAEIIELTASDQPANKIHYPKYIDKALNTYNKNKPND